MKPGKGTLIAAAAAAALLAGLGLAWKRHAGAALAKGDWVEVKKGDLVVEYQEVGELEPKVKVDVKSNVTGRVTRLLVAEGDRVRTGQLLAVVQPGQTPAERYLPYEVRSTMDGTVIKRNIEVGDAAVSGLAEFGAGTALMTVGDLSRMVVKLDVNEVDVPKLSLHQAADIHVDAFPDETFKGEIIFISPMAELNDQKVRVFKTKVEVLKADPRLRPGMTARVVVELARRPGAVEAPIEAVFDEGGERVAYVVGAPSDAKPVRTVVTTGLKDEVDVEVLSGLRPGQKLSLTRPEAKAGAAST